MGLGRGAASKRSAPAYFRAHSGAVTQKARPSEKRANAPAKERGKRAEPSRFVEGARSAKRVSDEKRAQKLEALVRLIQRRKARIVEDFYDIGEALRTILRERLFALRHATFEAFVVEELGLTRSTAFRLVAVVDALPRDKALELGQERSYALVTYAAATTEADTPLELADAPIARTSANEIKRAAAGLRARKTRASAPKATRDLLAEVAEALRALGLRSPVATLRGKTLTVRAKLPE